MQNINIFYTGNEHFHAFYAPTKIVQIGWGYHVNFCVWKKNGHYFNLANVYVLLREFKMSYVYLPRLGWIVVSKLITITLHLPSNRRSYYSSIYRWIWLRRNKYYRLKVEAGLWFICAESQNVSTFNFMGCFTVICPQLRMGKCMLAQ